MFLNIVEWGIKNPSFHTDLKNVNLILVKSAAKKSCSQKNNIPIEKVSEKSVFGCIFHKGKGQLYIFESSIKRRIFLYPIRQYSKQKSFHVIEESMCTFYELCGCLHPVLIKIKISIS
jgi:hypothetical protein